MKEPVMVSVLCATYNHENFIKEALEGMLAQKVNFSYEIIIHDDASTDGTVNIIKSYEEKYPNIIKPIYQEKNQFSQGIKITNSFLLPRVSGKYIAMCAGDDYWIDDEKLQKQISFLEEHPEYSMSLHNAVRYNDRTGEKTLLNTFEADGEYSQEKQIQVGLGTDFPAYSSYVLRASLLKDMPEFFGNANVLDYPLRQYYASKGKVYYFHKPMSVYRVATPQSYMSIAEKNQQFYNEYAIGMIGFFEKLNAYTDKEFNGILQRKMISDYYAFCASVPVKEGIEKAVTAGLDVEKVKRCYEMISEAYLPQEIANLQEKKCNIFIYGTSRMAMICKKQMETHQVPFEGFVVSDGRPRNHEVETKKVFYLSEVIEQYSNVGIILAVQPINSPVIEKILREYGVENYCKPYDVEEKDENL